MTQIQNKNMVRVKRRYILFEIIPNNYKLMDKLLITEKEIIESMRECVERLYGDLGLSSILQTIQLKRFNINTRTGVLSSKRSNHTIITTSLPFIRKVKQIDCIFRTIHISGTIRGCLKALRVHHNKQINCLRKQLNAFNKINSIQKGIQEIESSLNPQSIDSNIDINI